MKEVLRVYWFLLFLFLVTSLAHGQVRRDQASRIRFGTSLPATCNPSVGSVFFLITPGSPLGMHQCLSTDSYTPMIGSMSGSGEDNQVAVFTGPTDLEGTNTLTFDGTTLIVTGTLQTTDTQGPALLNEIGSSVNPTVIPNRTFLDSGISVIDDEDTQLVHLIAEGINVFNVSEGFANLTVTSTFNVNGALSLAGNADRIQGRFKAFSTQTNDILQVQDFGSSPLFGVALNGDALIAGNLAVTGAGPHAIAGAPFGAVQLLIGQTFTSDGSSTLAAGIFHTPTIVGADGDTDGLTGTTLTAAIITQTATENIANISQLQINEPAITDNLGGSGVITNAHTLLIGAAPTEGVNNFALRVASGLSQFGDAVVAANTSGYALLNEAASAINPTIIPNRLILDTGLGAVDNEGTGALHMVVEGTLIFTTEVANSTFDNTVRAGFGSTSWALLNITSTATVPTLIPNRSILTTGLGAVDEEGADHLHLIVDGTSIVDLTLANIVVHRRLQGNSQNAYALVNEVGTSTNPTIAPNRGFVDSGFSVTDSEGSQLLHLIVEGVDVMNFGTNRINAFLTGVFEINGGLFVDGNSDTIQMRIDAHSTQNTLLFRIRDSSAATILSVANGGDLTVSGGVATGPAPADSGGLRLSNNSPIVYKNQAGNGDIEILRVDFNDDTVLNADSGDGISFRIANSPEVDITPNVLGLPNDTASIQFGASLDAQIHRDGPDILAQRRGNNGQAWYVYDEFTDLSNYSRIAMYAGGPPPKVFEIEIQTAGTGTDIIDLALTSAGAGSFVKLQNGDDDFIALHNGLLEFQPDGTVGIGSIAANRPLAGFFAGELQVGLLDTSASGAQMLTFDSPNLTSGPAERDSHHLLFTGQAHTGSAQSDKDFRQFVDVTGTGSVTYRQIWQARTGGAPYRNLVAFGAAQNQPDPNVQGGFQVMEPANDGSTNIKSIQGTFTLNSNPVTFSNVIKAGQEVIGVTTRVDALITGSGVTGYLVGDGVDADRWGDVTGVAVGTQGDQRDATDPRQFFTADNDLTITAVGGSFTGGTLQFTIHYQDLTPPQCASNTAPCP